MNLKEVTNEIKLKICSSDTLGADFEIQLDYASDEFHAIGLRSHDKKEGFTVLVLPQLKDHKGEWQGWNNFLGVDNKGFKFVEDGIRLENKKQIAQSIVDGEKKTLFGDNSKGGEE